MKLIEVLDNNKKLHEAILKAEKVKVICIEKVVNK